MCNILNLREKFGKLIALGLVHKLTDSGDMALKKILEMLSGIYIAWAIKNSMMLVLNIAAALII